MATGSDRYLGQVSVYDRNQQLLFSWSSSKEYILSVSMGSGGNLAVACVNAVDGRVTTVVYALNIHREEELSRTEFPGSLALQMRWEGQHYPTGLRRPGLRAEKGRLPGGEHRL